MITNKTNKTNLTELNKLEEYLRKNGYNFERFDQDGDDLHAERHQLIVYDDNGKRRWDAICNWGSYGHAAGLIEVMGDIAESAPSRVIGWLMADKIIERLEVEP